MEDFAQDNNGAITAITNEAKEIINYLKKNPQMGKLTDEIQTLLNSLTSSVSEMYIFSKQNNEYQSKIKLAIKTKGDTENQIKEDKLKLDNLTNEINSLNNKIDDSKTREEKKELDMNNYRIEIAKLSERLEEDFYTSTLSSEIQKIQDLESEIEIKKDNLTEKMLESEILHSKKSELQKVLFQKQKELEKKNEDYDNTENNLNEETKKVEEKRKKNEEMKDKLQLLADEKKNKETEKDEMTLKQKETLEKIENLKKEKMSLEKALKKAEAESQTIKKHGIQRLEKNNKEMIEKNKTIKQSIIDKQKEIDQKEPILKKYEKERNQYMLEQTKLIAEIKKNREQIDVLENNLKKLNKETEEHEAEIKSKDAQLSILKTELLKKKKEDSNASQKLQKLYDEVNEVQEQINALFSENRRMDLKIFGLKTEAIN